MAELPVSDFRKTCGMMLLVILASSTARAQEQGGTEIDRARWSELYGAVAKRMQVDVSDVGKASINPEPFFRWENPVREGRTQGDFFVWFADRHPVLVGTIFSYDWPVGDGTHRSVSVELHGLTDRALEVDYAPHFQWKAPADAMTASQLEQVPPPSQRRTQRLTQMRRIASRVEASTELNGTKMPLRLLPTPLYRFDGPESIPEEDQVLDGAIFAFVTGTDPELLVVVQALRAEDGAFAWYLTPARFTNLPLSVEYDGTVVFESRPASRGPLYFDGHRVHHVPTALPTPAASVLDE